MILVGDKQTNAFLYENLRGFSFWFFAVAAIDTACCRNNDYSTIGNYGKRKR